MFRSLAALCAAIAVPLALAPVANAAEPAPVLVELEPRHGMVVGGDGIWHAHEDAYFKVRVTATGDENLDEATVRVSVPDEIELITISNADWDCWDVSDGVACHNPDVVVPGEAWDDLLIYAKVNEHMDDVDSIDAYVTTGDYEEAHTGVLFHGVPAA